MGQMRVTVFFEAGEYGWTETLFPATTDYNQAQTMATAYCNVRAPLMASGSAPAPGIIAFRVSDDSLFRDAFDQFFQPPLIGSASSGPLHPTTALLLRLTATALVRRPIYIRGIPADIMDNAGNYVPNFVTSGLINTYRNFLLATPGWKIRTTVSSPPRTIYSLASIVPPNSFTTTAPNGFNAGDVVIVKGSSRNRNPVGLWKVGPGPGLTNFILTGVDLPSNYTYVAGSLGVQLKIPATGLTDLNYLAITEVTDERLTERRTGRPFGQPRGRRSPHRV